jgi:hypothetical protein
LTTPKEVAMSLTTRFESLIKDRVDALQNHETVKQGREKLDALVDRHLPAAVVAPLRKEMSLDSLGVAARAAQAELKAWLKRDARDGEPEVAAVTPEVDATATERAADEAEARDAT